MPSFMAPGGTYSLFFGREHWPASHMRRNKRDNICFNLKHEHTTTSNKERHIHTTKYILSSFQAGDAQPHVSFLSCDLQCKEYINKIAIDVVQ